MRFLAMTGLVGMLAWSSATLLHGGDQAANEPAVLSVRGTRSARSERIKPIGSAPHEAGAVVRLPALLPQGVVLVSDDRITERQLEAPLDWPSDIAEEGAVSHGAPQHEAPGRFEPAPTLSVVEPPASTPSGRSILSARPAPQETATPETNSLRVAQRPRRASAPVDGATPAAPAQEWRSSNSHEPTETFGEPSVAPAQESTLPPSSAFAGDASTPVASDELSHSPAVEAKLDSIPAQEPVTEIAPETQTFSAAPTETLSQPEQDPDFAFVNEEPQVESNTTPAVPQPEAQPAQEPGFEKESSPSESPSAESFAPQGDAAESFAQHAESFAPQGGAADPQTGGNDVSCRWVVPEQLNLGEQATCRMIVCNGGSSPAHAVLVRIELPKNVRLVNADPAPNAAGQAMTWKIARLEPGQNHEVLLTVVPTAEGNVTPTAMVTCTRAAQASIAIRKPNLEIKVEGGERLSLGQPATYQLVVHNTGSGAAANVQLAARFSEGLHHPQGQEVRYRVGTLSAGETRNVQLPLTGLRPGACEIEVLVATGEKLAAETKRNVEVVKPTLQVALSGPKLRYVDRKATYMLKVHNPGPAPADNVQLLEQLPEGMRFLEASPGGSFDPNLKQVAWFVGRLEPKQTAEVGVHVVAEEAGDHTLAAVAKADSGVTAKVKTMTKVEGVSLVVLDVVDRDDPIEAGSETAYEVRVTNRGSEPAHQVQVAARLPESMSAVKATGPTEGSVDGRQVVFEPLASLAPGQSQTFTVSVRCLKAGAARFQAFFRSQEEPKALLQEETTRIYGE